MWLQGYVLGVTGTELSPDQLSRIGENLEKIDLVQVPKPANSACERLQFPDGWVARC